MRTISFFSHRGAMLAAAALLFFPVSSAAQAGLGSGRAGVGETYNIEAAGGFWNPQPELIVRSESLGLAGTDVDLVGDLGIEQKNIPELRLVLRPATKHKFRFSYLPLKYSAEAVVQRQFVFNGQVFRLGVPVNTTANLTTFRGGYEYDFFYRSRGYIGVLLDVKYTNVDVELETPVLREFTSQVAPIPTLGVVGRGYIIPNVSITGEVSFFSVPDNVAEQIGGDGRYIDYDFYGTFNINRYVGAQLGLRSIDVSYTANDDRDAGVLNFAGWYFGGVIRY
jgi:hypothetical protein